MGEAVIKTCYVALIIAPLLLAKCTVGYALVDRSAKSYGDGLIWHGISYQPADYFPTPRHGGFLAKDQTGASITGYGNDPEHTYVMRTSFLDNYLLVRADYKFRPDDDVSAVYIDGNQVAFPAETKSLKAIFSDATSSGFRCSFSNFNDLKRVAVSHNKSQVGDDYLGYITYFKGDWFYIDKLPKADFNQLYHGNRTSLDCAKIDPGYSSAFSRIHGVYSWFTDPEFPRNNSVEPAFLSEETE